MIKHTLVRWEYSRTIPGLTRSGTSPETEEEFLSRMGGDGWELIQVLEYSGSRPVGYYFKRPKSVAE